MLALSFELPPWLFDEFPEFEPDWFPEDGLLAGLLAACCYFKASFAASSARLRSSSSFFNLAASSALDSASTFSV